MIGLFDEMPVFDYIVKATLLCSTILYIGKTAIIFYERLIFKGDKQGTNVKKL